MEIEKQVGDELFAVEVLNIAPEEYSQRISSVAGAAGNSCCNEDVSEV